MSSVHELPSPRADDIGRLWTLFQAAGSGLIELAWTQRTEPFKLDGARQFDLGDWDDLVETAATLNASPNCNLYFSLGLRREGTRGRGGDADVTHVVGLKADFDRVGVAERALEKLGEAMLCPTHWVVTGRHPHLRAHAYWLLDEPTDALALAGRLEKAIAHALGGDPSITNPSRVMRVPGSVAWPLKAGRELEQTGWLDWQTRCAWTLDELERAVGAAGWLAPEPERVVAGPWVGINLDFSTAPEQQPYLDVADRLGGAAEPGQWHDSVLRAIAQLLAKGVPPDIVLTLLPATVRQEGYSLEQTVEEVRVMLAGAVKKGMFREARPEEGGKREEAKPGLSPATRDPFPVVGLEAFDDLDEERYLIDGLLPDYGLAAIYGESGSLKSFIGLDMGMRIAWGHPYYGRAVERAPVLYVCAEGQKGFKKRGRAWMDRYAPGDRSGLFKMVLTSVNLSDEALVAYVIAQIEAMEQKPKAVFIDTLARCFGAGDENSTKDMNRFVANCYAIAEGIAGLVVLIHHSGKDRERGMRGSYALTGACDAKFLVERGPDKALWARVTAEKSKDDEEAPPIKLEFGKAEITHPKTGEVLTTLVPVGLYSDGEEEDEPQLPRMNPSQWRALRTLVQLAKAVGPTELGNALGVSKYSARDRLNELLELKMVAHGPDGLWRPVGQFKLEENQHA